MRQLHTNFVWAITNERQQMLVENGRVAERGTSVSVEGPVERLDHGGKKLAPCFLDSHCHILPTGLDLLKLHLGQAESREEVLDLLSTRHREFPDNWLLAVHYDHNKFPDGKHLTKADLDKISVDRPILIRHVSGHSGVANSAALSAAQVSSDSRDPAGGTFVRLDDGSLNGVLLETALELVSRAMPLPSLEEMVTAILAAGDSMREWQIVNASDMQTGTIDVMLEVAAYRLAAERGCKTANRLYVNWSRMFGPRQTSGLRKALEELDGDRCRVGGIKLFADGAIGSSTAAVYGAYAGQPQTGSYSGTLIYEPEKLTAKVVEAASHGYQVSVHAIGDYAIDLVMDAFEATDNPSHHRLEHAMILSDVQIERLAKIDCHVTMQPEFLMRFGHTYQRQLGPERASKLLRFRSILDAGLRLSFSSDRPITKGDPKDGIALATQRPEGFDSSENCTFAEAIDAYTTKAAELTGEESETGTLLPGSLADFQILQD